MAQVCWEVRAMHDDNSSKKCDFPSITRTETQSFTYVSNMKLNLVKGGAGSRWTAGTRGAIHLSSGRTQEYTIVKVMTSVEEVKEEPVIIVDEPVKAPPSAFFLELLAPMELTQDFLANMREIHADQWVPRYGEKRAKLLWHRQCLGLIVRHWFEVFIGAAQRLRQVFYS